MGGPCSFITLSLFPHVCKAGKFLHFYSERTCREHQIRHLVRGRCPVDSALEKRCEACSPSSLMSQSDCTSGHLSALLWPCSCPSFCLECPQHNSEHMATSFEKSALIALRKMISPSLFLSFSTPTPTPRSTCEWRLNNIHLYSLGIYHRARQCAQWLCAAHVSVCWIFMGWLEEEKEQRMIFSLIYPRHFFISLTGKNNRRIERNQWLLTAPYRPGRGPSPSFPAKHQNLV